MRWDKLSPLLVKVDPTYRQVRHELEAFLKFVQTASDVAD
jgi:hypothetical protein